MTILISEWTILIFYSTYLFFVVRKCIFEKTYIIFTMNTDLWVIVCVAILLLVCSALILMGRGDWLISGYNTAKKEKKERYNLFRLRLLTGLSCIYFAIIIIVGYYTDDKSFLAYAILPVAILMMILSNTWAKRQ